MEPKNVGNWFLGPPAAGAGLEGARIFNFSATTSCLTWDTCEAQNFVEVCTTEGPPQVFPGSPIPVDLRISFRSYCGSIKSFKVDP